jgi:hypothetical protein
MDLLNQPETRALRKSGRRASNHQNRCNVTCKSPGVSSKQQLLFSCLVVLLMGTACEATSVKITPYEQSPNKGDVWLLSESGLQFLVTEKIISRGKVREVMKECRECSGIGLVTEQSTGKHKTENCENCSGTGQVIHIKCKIETKNAEGGTEANPIPETCTVTFPDYEWTMKWTDGKMYRLQKNLERIHLAEKYTTVREATSQCKNTETKKKYFKHRKKATYVKTVDGVVIVYSGGKTHFVPEHDWDNPKLFTQPKCDWKEARGGGQIKRGLFPDCRKWLASRKCRTCKGKDETFVCKFCVGTRTVSRNEVEWCPKCPTNKINRKCKKCDGSGQVKVTCYRNEPRLRDSKKSQTLNQRFERNMGKKDLSTFKYECGEVVFLGREGVTTNTKCQIVSRELRGTKPLTKEHWIVCKECTNGKTANNETCEECDGQGVVTKCLCMKEEFRINRNMADGGADSEEAPDVVNGGVHYHCKECKEKPEIQKKNCKACKGTGIHIFICSLCAAGNFNMEEDIKWYTVKILSGITLEIPEEYIITKAQRDLLLAEKERKDLNSNLQKSQDNKGALGVTGLNLIQGLTKPRTRRKRSGSFSEALPQPDKYFLHREAPPLGFKNNRRRLSEVDRLNRRIQQQTAYMQRERQ